MHRLLRWLRIRRHDDEVDEDGGDDGKELMRKWKSADNGNGATGRLFEQTQGCKMGRGKKGAATASVAAGGLALASPSTSSTMLLAAGSHDFEQLFAAHDLEQKQQKKKGSKSGRKPLHDHNSMLTAASTSNGGAMGLPPTVPMSENAGHSAKSPILSPRSSMRQPRRGNESPKTTTAAGGTCLTPTGGACLTPTGGGGGSFRQLRFRIPQGAAADPSTLMSASTGSDLFGNDDDEDDEDQRQDGDLRFMSRPRSGTRSSACSALSSPCTTPKERRQSGGSGGGGSGSRRQSTTLVPLTPAQIHLVRSLWRQVFIVKGPTVLGTGIYHRLVFKEPKVKDLMRRCALPPQFNNHDELVRAHSKAIAELIDHVVESLDRLDAVGDTLVALGRLHAGLIHGELSSKFWNLVAETLIDCTLEWGDRRCRSETVRKAWALIVAFMVDRIKCGHHEQRKAMLSGRQQ